MEIATLPPPPPGAFSFDGGAYPTEPSSRNPFASDDVAAVAGNNPFLGPAALTAPPSPNPFGILLPASSAVDDGGDPFDLFQHFASAPASPARAAAIYAHFSADHHEYEGFEPRASPRTPKVTASSVPFEWEEKPGKPKPGFGSTPVNGVFEGDEDADFDFGVLLDGRSAQTPAAADELFDGGRIRPLKPPPRLLADSGSVGSSPRSPMTARSAMWSPRLRRSTVRPAGADDDFDPFAAAMAKASSMAPSPLGPGALTGGAATSLENNPDSVTSPPFAPLPPPSSSTGNGGTGTGRKRWRLSDLLLFRRLSAKGRATAATGGSNISRDPVFKYSPVQNLGTPVKKTTDGGDVSGAGKQQRKQSKYGEDDGGMQHSRQSFMVGCIRLNPGLHRLAKKGLHARSSSHFGRRTARSAMAG